MNFLLLLLLPLLTNANNEKQLVETLLANYNSNNLPIINNSYVNLTMGLALRSLNKIDQIDGTLAANIWLRHGWYDEYLSWDPEDWNNITDIVLYTDSDATNVIWTPDIYLYNTAEKPNDNLEYSRAMVNSSGYVIWSRPGIIESTCRFDLTHFPYDQQICNFKFGSWSYNGYLLKLKLNDDEIDISNFQKHEEWDLVDNTAILNIEYYGCCPHPYYDTVFEIIINRKPGFYILNVIIPTFATASLMLISLLIPWDSGERISFVITVMLAIIVFLLLLSENLPKSDNEPLLSRMIIGLVFFSQMVVFVTVVLSYMRNYKYGVNKHIDKIINLCYGCNERVEFDENLNRNNSYLKSLKIKKKGNNDNDIDSNDNDIDSNDNDIDSNDNSNRSEQKVKKDCKKYAQKIEFIFSILFTSSFFIFCLVVHLMRPKY